MQLTKKLTITIFLLGGLSLVIFGAVAIPTILSIRNIQADIAEEYMNIEQRYALRRHTRSSLDTLKQIQPTLEKLSGMVIIEGKELDFISALEEAASLSGIIQDLALETVNQREISPWERDVPIRIRAAGNYSSVMAYLERINAMSYYIVVSNFDVSAASGQKPNQVNPNQIKAEIRGSIRWFSKTHPILAGLYSDDSMDLQDTE